MSPDVAPRETAAKLSERMCADIAHVHLTWCCFHDELRAYHKRVKSWGVDEFQRLAEYQARLSRAAELVANDCRWPPSQQLQDRIRGDVAREGGDSPFVWSSSDRKYAVLAKLRAKMKELEASGD